MRTARWTALTAALVATLAVAACAPVDDAPTGDPTSTAGGLATVKDGVLTIATSDPAYEPWVVDNDPSNGEGFESAVAYAVAEQLGYDADQVEWTVASFDQIIAPGAKDFDFAVNQVSISDERSKSLAFSSPYYETTQAVVTLEGSPAADTTSLADLKDVRIGAMVGTTSLTAAQNTIAPTTPVSPFNDNDQVKQALTSGLVDAIVVDLPTALYVTAAELDGGVLVGQLPGSAGGDQFGLVMDLDSPLTADVSAAVDALREDGTLAELEAQWLTDAAGAPVLK
ncbi:ABC transporter substrate-binding protein [Cellulomonas algicola]|uniref:ABC transporter substrate-binding protein n=1 Tax=Cellulomonas algicola TaxID=2071633 RepID=UPI001C3F82B0|nr:ABC transporter substrate-binding protein [Cellulomonas algicola]